MGYFVNGGGMVISNKEVPEEVLALLVSAEFFVEDSPDGGIWLTFEDRNFNDQVEESLKALAPYVRIGNVEFTGEDGEHFRYEFDEGKLWYCDGEIVYKRRNEVV